MPDDFPTEITPHDARPEVGQRPSRSRSARSEPGSVQSVDRALGLLEALARSGSGASLTGLADETKLNISTCHHLLATLAKWGYVAKVPGSRSYALGARVLHLSQSFLRQVDLPRRAQPVLEELSKATGETAHLAVLQGDTVVTVAKCEARHAVRVDTGPVGASEPAHATSSGKSMLAWLPEEQMRRILAVNSLPRFTPGTITDVAALVEELRHVRRNGFALDREEYQLGVTSVGAAVRDEAGAVIGAISASAPTFRASDDHQQIMREAVIAAALSLSAEFGAPAIATDNEDQMQRQKRQAGRQAGAEPKP